MLQGSIFQADSQSKQTGPPLVAMMLGHEIFNPELNRHVQQKPTRHSYNQVFRSRAAESVIFAGAWMSQEKLIPSTWVTTCFRTAIAQNISALGTCGLSGPAIIGVAKLDVNDYRIAVGGAYHMFNPGYADRNALVLPEAWLDNLESVTDVDAIVRPQMDILWQAFGVDHCLEYSPQGAWNPRRS